MSSSQENSISSTLKHHTRSTGRNGRGLHTRARIIAEARKQITARGLKATSATTITSALNIPRPLFYHYFKNLDELVQIILEEIVNTFIDSLAQWKAGRAQQDIEASLHTLVGLWRSVHHDNSVFANELAREGNAALYKEFMVATSDQLARFLTDEVVPTLQDKMYRPIDHVYETLFALTVGLNELIAAHPEFSTANITHIIAQTLHIEDHIKSRTK